MPKSNNKIRLCVDMHAANLAIKRIRYPIPTAQDMSLELNGVKIFSKLDLSQTYHQLELAQSSRFITTFTTHLGLYRYKRLNYGTNAASEIALQQTLHGIKDCKNLADDIIIFGKDRAAHDLALEQCLQRLQQNNFILNLSKCRFLKENLDFFGYIFSKEGSQPDRKKIAAFVNVSTPTPASDVRSLLKMANFSSKFIPNFVTITAPLHKLTCKDVRFKWEHEHDHAFNQLQLLLTKSPVMQYFDITKETHVDASPVGLSVILTQKSLLNHSEHVFAYASRAPSEVETRYSQTEKEALAIVWGAEHFHIYLYGSQFTLHTDHTPLQLIYGNPYSNLPLRIQRWFLRLQQYNFSIVNKPGSENPADYLSRHPIVTSPKPSIAEEYVVFVSRNDVPKAVSLDEIQASTQADRELCAVREAVTENRWGTDIVQPYLKIRDEICIDYEHGISLHGHHIVTPTNLPSTMVENAHEEHQGLAKTKALLREYVLFPGIDHTVQEIVHKCLVCQATGQPKAPAPIQSSSMPQGPWAELSIVFYGPRPTGQHLLVILDNYSRYTEVEIVTSTSAKSIISKLDSIFARHGIPDKMKSDNGPPLASEEFS